MKTYKSDKLSILLLARSEGERMRPMLESCHQLGPIVAVIDPETLDETIKLLKEFEVKIIERTMDNFAAQRNAGLTEISTEWTLMLDADETLTTSLTQEVVAAIQNPADKVGFEMPRENQVFGTILHHGDWYPDWQLRLYRTKQATYKYPVHEKLIISGPIGRLTNPLQHENYLSINHYIQKLNQYTEHEAAFLDEHGKHFSPAYLLGKPLKEFWRCYFVQQGYKDGRVGFIAAWLKAIYRGVAVLKLWERQKNRQ